MEWVLLDGIGLNWAGPDWVGFRLEWIGLEWGGEFAWVRFEV